MERLATPWEDRCLVAAGEPPLDWFGEEELREMESLRLQKRRVEWRISRAAAKRLAVELELAAAPARCTVRERRLLVDGIESGWNLSLSHSGPYGAAALSRQPVGIDVQVVRPFDDAASHLFLDDRQTAVMQQCSIPDRLLHWWCAKEAAWKQFAPRFDSLKQVPLELLAESAAGLRFEGVETALVGDVVVALAG